MCISLRVTDDVDDVDDADDVDSDVETRACSAEQALGEDNTHKPSVLQPELGTSRHCLPYFLLVSSTRPTSSLRHQIYLSFFHSMNVLHCPRLF